MNGSVERRVAALDARLARIEAMLGRLETTMGQAQLAGATVVDAVDDIARRQGDALQLTDRTERLASLVETLTRPQNLAALEQLAEGATAIAPMAPMIGELPNVLATAVDAVDDMARRNPELSLPDRAEHLLKLVEVATRPEHLEALTKLAALFANIAPMLPLLARLTEPQLLNRLEKTLDAAEHLGPALDAAISAEPARAGMWDLWRALKDPDVQRAIHRGIVLARAAGQQDTHLASSKLLSAGEDE